MLQKVLEGLLAYMVMSLGSGCYSTTASSMDLKAQRHDKYIGGQLRSCRWYCT